MKLFQTAAAPSDDQVSSLMDIPEYRDAAMKLATLLDEDRRADARVIEINNTIVSWQHGGGADKRSAENLRVELLNLHHRRRALVNEICAAREAVSSARATGSSIICKFLEPRHREQATRIANAMVALGEAIIDAAELRAELESGDVSYVESLPSLAFSSPDDPRSPRSPISYWLREQITRGLIDKTLVPASWRREWSQK